MRVTESAVSVALPDWAWKRPEVRQALRERDIAALLHHNMVRAVAVPEVQDRLVTLGFEPATTGPEQLAPFIKAEIPKWAGVIRAAGINTD